MLSIFLLTFINHWVNLRAIELGPLWHRVNDHESTFFLNIIGSNTFGMSLGAGLSAIGMLIIPRNSLHVIFLDLFQSSPEWTAICIGLFGLDLH